MTASTGTEVTVDAIYARDAYQSAVTLAALLVAWGTMNLVLAPMLPWWPTRACFAMQVALAGTALAYFTSTWRRPRLVVALQFSLLQIAISLVLVLIGGFDWLSLGRPLDAFVGVQVALISMPLVVPRYVWLGVNLIALFSIEGVVLSLGTGGALPMEPYLSLAFGVHALGHVIVRGRQRSLAAKHVLLEGEEVALQRLAPMLASVRAQLGTELVELSETIRSLGPPENRAATDRAVARLVAVERQLRTLARNTPNGAPVDTSREAERRFNARSAHLGATALAGLAAVISVLALPAFSATAESRAMMICLGLVALGAFAVLTMTREHPSERRAFVVSGGILFIALCAVTFNHFQFSKWGGLDEPFEPFSGHKLLMVTVALIAPLHVRVGLAIVGFIMANALAFYFAGFVPSRLPVVEPWATVLVAAMAVGYLFMWNERRRTALSLLRTELETSTLRRRATLFFSLRDRLNSPLQALVLRLAKINLQEPSSATAQRAASALERLLALSNELLRLQEELPPQTLPDASLDAEHDLQNSPISLERASPELP